MFDYDPELEAGVRYQVLSVCHDVHDHVDFWCEVGTVEEAEARMFDLLETHGYNSEFSIIDIATGEVLLRVSTLWRPL